MGSFQRIVAGGSRKARAELPDGLTCPACSRVIGRIKRGRLMIRAHNRALAVTSSGRVEVTCGGCGGPVVLPLSLTRRKDVV